MAISELSSIIAEAICDGRVRMYGIKLKTPEKYNITKSSEDGHILFTSQYFIGHSDEVEAIIQYHIDKNKADSCTHTE